MLDFPITTFIDVIPVTSIEFIDKVTLAITATDVSGITRIQINGVEVEEYMVTSPTEVFATIPVSVRQLPLETIQLVGKSNEAAMVEFKSTTIQKMTDSVYVLQKFFRSLFMSPGSSAFFPDEGVNIMSLVGSTTIGNIEAELVQKVKNAETLVKEKQKPESESSRLLSVVKVNNISYSVNTLTASISLTLEMLDGSTVAADFNTVG